MRPFLLALCATFCLAAQARAAEGPAAPAPEVKIKPKAAAAAGDSGSLLAPDVDVIDAPTSAVLDYGGYSARSRFFSNGGLLQHVSFGVFHGLNLGASLSLDGLIGSEKTVRVREPNVQIKWRFYEGDRTFPSLAVGFDGQGTNYNQPAKIYNQRKRGFFVVATQELGLPGLQTHPSMNISDFDSNSFFGSIPVTYNIRDKVSVMGEWDNINDFSHSRLNLGLRVYVTKKLHIDFAARGLGQGSRFSDGTSRGPERIVQLKYSGNF